MNTWWLMRHTIMSSLKVHIIVVNSIAVFLHFCNIGMKIETTICKRLKKRKKKKKKKKLYQVYKILNFLWGLRKMIDRLPYPHPPILFIYFLLLLLEKLILKLKPTSFSFWWKTLVFTLRLRYPMLIIFSIVSNS